MGKELTKKEKSFCICFVQSRDARMSAALAGYRLPQISAVKLLGRPEIKEEIRRLESAAKTSPGEVYEGYRRLGFGSTADAVRLMKNFDKLTDDEIERLDLFNVSEIKMPKSGGIEIKFSDRLKALNCLESACCGGGKSTNSLVAAIEEGAANLNVRADDLYGDKV